MIAIGFSLAFTAITFFVFLINGLPWVLLLDRAGDCWRNVLAAPILGTAALSFVMTVLYRFGVPPQLSLLVTTALSLGAASAFASTALRHAPARSWSVLPLLKNAYRRARPFLAFSALVLVTSLLPRYIGGLRFAIFQANPGDSINYLTESFGFANYPFAVLRSLPQPLPPDPVLVFTGDMLFARPAVGLLYGALSTLLSSDVFQHSYEFRVLLQFNLFLAMSYLFLLLIPHRQAIAFGLSASFAIGFYGQYVFDINAWSELLALPIQIILVSQFCEQLANRISSYRFKTAAASETRAAPTYLSITSAASISVLSIGLLYAYPEITPITALLMVGTITLSAAYVWRTREWRLSIGILSISLSVLVVVILAATLYWSGTIAFFLTQAQFAVIYKNNWHLYFDQYLIADRTHIGVCTVDYWFCNFIYDPVTVFAYVTKGLLGLYFIPLLLSKKEELLVFFWSLGLSVVTLIFFRNILLAFRANRIANGEQVVCRAPTILSFVLAGSMFAATLPIYLFFIGQYFAAGKGLSALFPFVFVVICTPILTNRAPTVQLLSWSIVASHLLFGVARPIAVGLKPYGHFFGAPYVQLAGNLRADYDWDIGKHAGQLGSCRLIRLEISQQQLERVVQIYLQEKGLPWYSSLEQYSTFDHGLPLGKMTAPGGQVDDCTISDAITPIFATPRLIWLRTIK